jgi:hypothetical protein
MSARSVLLEVTSVTTIDGNREPSSGPKFVKRIYGNLEAHLETSKIIHREMPAEQQKEWDDYIRNKLYNKQEIFEEKEYARTKASINLHSEETRAPAELCTGYDKSPFQRGLRHYGKLRKIHKNAMRQELQAQEIAFEKQWGIKGLVKQLKDHLWTKWILQNPGVGAKVYDDDTEKTQYFRLVTRQF